MMSRPRFLPLLGLLLLGCTADTSPEADPMCFSESAVVEQVFGPSCSSCHNAERPRAKLDLETPGMAKRMIGQTSVFDDCSDELLLVPGDPDASWLLKKIHGDVECGKPMPPEKEDELAPVQVRCVEQWIESLPSQGDE